MQEWLDAIIAREGNIGLWLTDVSARGWKPDLTGMLTLPGGRT